MFIVWHAGSSICDGVSTEELYQVCVSNCMCSGNLNMGWPRPDVDCSTTRKIAHITGLLIRYYRTTHLPAANNVHYSTDFPYMQHFFMTLKWQWEIILWDNSIIHPNTLCTGTANDMKTWLQCFIFLACKCTVTLAFAHCVWENMTSFCAFVFIHKYVLKLQAWRLLILTC